MCFLKMNDNVTLCDRSTVTVIGKIGEGGQGIVYRVRLDGTNQEYALKWYFYGCLDNPENFYKHLSRNIYEIGSPGVEYIWPKQLTKYFAGETFGYIMDIIPSEYRSMSKYLMTDVSFSNTKAMVNAALNIVVAIKKLHDKGYSYKDLHDENFFIEPDSGKILICDTDNVTGPNEESKIIGKPYYIAPEVVCGNQMPDKYSDRYSLAVLLFYLLIGDHPLMGKKTHVPILTNKLDQKFFGREPLFIFDSTDNSNAPVPGLHRNAQTFWKYFPSFVREFFQRAFSQTSLHNPQQRPIEQEWIHILMRLKSSIARCPQCGEELFVESDRRTHCYSCGCNFQAAGYLSFQSRHNIEVTVPIYKNAVIYNYHTETSMDFHKPVGGILQENNRFGLVNVSNKDWIVTNTNGDTRTIPVKKVQTLRVGYKIDFGNNIVATVKANS